MFMTAVTTMLLAVVAAFGQSPQAAAKHVVYSSNGSRVVIVRTNVAWPYATVLVHGGYMEGSPADDAALLFKHFSFGWQGLESLDFRCRLTSQVPSPQARTQLMRGMPAPRDRSACGNRNLVDAGPPAAIEAIRKSRDEPLVPAVIISGNFALVAWYGAGGGQNLLEKRAERWYLLADGGGLIDDAEMRAYGVPQAARCLFGSHDAKCAQHGS